MTTDALAKLTPAQKGQKIAAICKWKRCHCGCRLWDIGEVKVDSAGITADLNAMHEAEKVLTTEQRETYARYLYSPHIANVTDWDIFDAAHSTAAVRADSFLLVAG